MIDLIASTVDEPLDEATLGRFKREAFLAVLEEERGRLMADPALVDGLIAEVEEAFATQARSSSSATPPSVGAQPANRPIETSN